MIEKWYRGHQGNKKATDNFGIIWLSDDPDYAQLYAEEYPDGIVSTIFIDMDKIKELDWYYDEDFDPYDPDMDLVRDYMNEQGGNAYTFATNDGTTVLALLSTEPIVKIERKINECKKHYKMKIKLSESRLRQIVAESVKKVLKETEDEWVPKMPTADKNILKNTKKRCVCKTPEECAEDDYYNAIKNGDNPLGGYNRNDWA